MRRADREKNEFGCTVLAINPQGLTEFQKDNYIG